MKNNYSMQAIKLLDQMDVSVLVLGIEDGKMLYVNQSVCKNLNRAPRTMIGRHYTELFTPEFCLCYESILEKSETQMQQSTIFYWKTHYIWEQISSSMIEWDANNPAMLLCITNITEVGRQLYTYERMAYVDALLEIPNGAMLEEDLNALESKDKVILISIDIAQFENINDLYGFSVGDALLIKVRDWLFASETRDMLLYRVNNGFVMMGFNITYEEHLKRAEEIVKRFKDVWDIEMLGTSARFYCIANVAVMRGKYVRNEMRSVLLRTAKTPKNEAGFAIYNEETDAAAKRKLLLRQTLSLCIYQGMMGFSVVYHPIVEAHTKKWWGAEVLCRWCTPSGEVIPPSLFIELAEMMGLVDKIDEWVRQTAIKQCLDWGLGNSSFMLNINFTPLQEMDMKFAKKLVKSLEQAGYPELKVNLEMTENVKMKFSDTTIEGLQYLKEKGVLFSLDDFGTAYSSIANLLKVPASFLKTEKMFLDNLLIDEDRKYLLGVLINLAHRLNMKIISEGVETLEQYELLTKLNVDYVQGYYFSKPLTADQFEKEIWRYHA